MKKILFSIFILSVFCHTANAKILLADNNTCIIDDNGYNRGWFCGPTDATECGGKKVTGNNRKKHELEHGAKFEHDKAPVKALQELNESNKTSNKNFYCCIPDGQSAGTWVASDNTQFSTSQEITVSLENGSCKYTRTTDACGNVTGTPCNNPTTCNNGYELKNNKCTKIETKSDTTTDTGNDSNSNNGNNNSNNDSGNSSNNDNNNNNNDNNNSNSGSNWGGNNYNSTPKSGKTYLSYAAGALQSCWRCGHNQSMFKSCVEVMSTTPAERSKHPEYGTVKSECKTGI